MTQNHLLLLDASGFGYRAYYAFTPRFTDDGTPTAAVVGFMALIFNLLGRASVDQPTHAAAIFDHPSKTFRHRLYPAYKADRTRKEELEVQLPMMREAARIMGMEALEMKGYEADDILATLAVRAAAAGMRTTIVTSDKDLMQLVKDNVIEIVDPMAKRRIGEAEVKKKFGCVPALVPDVQALSGDSVDGIPGVPGVGIEIAAGLIRSHGNLDKLLAYIDKKRSFIGRPSLTAALRRERKNIPLYRELATLKTNVKIKVEFETLSIRPIMRSHLDEMLRALEASPMQRALFSSDRTIFRQVPKAKADPFAWHAAALAGKASKIIPDIPQCGWYKRRLVRGGPWVAARIWREPDTDLITNRPNGNDILMCEVGADRRDVYSEWMKLCTQPIKESDYLHLAAEAKWAKDHAHDEAEANPTKPRDWNRTPL